ncbi:2-dehydro-3-deoxy-D-gluconate 5-dehydrogenase KduD [Halobacillus sp. Marseille-Q1614]|uniref:2-dehydro-3-deoxy-D-gluconate 5-dehydrogenase KduD n=1 Tax=Halobacillus sp. Marseille-Q1614 TaxID=2709134 RepID=UPI00156DB49F|nr:2-dehydro-3-deoxy-D-gluconate 5-dehydrogenase KduD [Halobacillus sp. Marseille-Q1614]
MFINYFNLCGKTAVVTGGNRGLGGAMAYGLAEAGADVAIVQQSAKETEVVQNIRDLGRKCEVFTFDLSETRRLPELVDSIIESFGKIDVLVNNAGVQRRSPAVEFSEEDWDFVIQVNQKAVFVLCQLVGKKMIEQGSGKIINLASLLSFQGGYTVPAYAAAKGAVAQFTKSLANEWASKNVNVNAIAPGYMATEMNTALMGDEARSRQIIERIPAGRWGTPEDMIGAAVFLASRASENIHGEIITVDGGWMG